MNLPTLTRTDSHDSADFSRGDLVNVQGLAGTYWRLLDFVTNEDTGAVWATVYGGQYRAGKSEQARRQYHSVDPSRLQRSTLPKRVRQTLAWRS